MKLIIGLGNPEKKYGNTRHNLGFLIVDEIAKRLGAEFKSKLLLKGHIASTILQDEKLLLAKPKTFMNRSGDCLRMIMRKNKVDPTKTLIIFDDADIALREMRLKESGSSGGHNGMKSIQETFPKGTNVPRLRIGIGRDPNSRIPLEDWVLQKWSMEEKEQLPEIVSNATDKAIEWLEQN
jgi:peptidyl-tRNA hydrolase, PTH1 family